MEHTSRPQPLVIARVFASLAPTMYLNMYSFRRHDNLSFPGLQNRPHGRPRDEIWRARACRKGRDGESCGGAGNSLKQPGDSPRLSSGKLSSANVTVFVIRRKLT